MLKKFLHWVQKVSFTNEMFQVSHLSCYKANHGKKPCIMLVLCDATQHKVVFPWLCNALSYSPAWLRWLHWCCIIPVNEKHFCNSVSFHRAIRLFYGSFKFFLRINNGFNRNGAILLIFDWGRCSLMPWASSGERESGRLGHQSEGE